MYFKHKCITQPAVMPADAVIKALQDLTHAIKGERNVKGEAQLVASAQLQQAFLPGHTLIPKRYNPPPRTLPQQAPRVETEQPRADPPRVHFETAPPTLQMYNADLRVPMDFPRVEQQVPELLPVEQLSTTQ